MLAIDFNAEFLEVSPYSIWFFNIYSECMAASQMLL
jgi:hypothetical protein